MTGSILTVAGHLGTVGGSEVAQLRIFKGLAQEGWDVHLLYVGTGDRWSEWDSLAATMTRIRATLPSPSSPVASTIGTLGSVMAGVKTHPSLIYVHSAGDTPLAQALAMVTRRPVVAHLHLPPPVRQPGWLNASLRRSDAVIAPSSDAAARWIGASGIDPAVLSVIPTGVDLDAFVPLDGRTRVSIREGIGVDPDDRMILYAGRMEWNKGAHVLLDAVGHLDTPVHVVLCGPSDDAGYHASLQWLLGQGKGTMLGPRSDVASLMAAADLVVLPSMVPETQGLVVSEAMACGTPVVACNVGGVAASMRGFPDQLVPPNDPVRMAETIGQYVDWRADRPDLGRRSRAWVATNLPLRATIEAIDEVLARVERIGEAG